LQHYLYIYTTSPYFTSNIYFGIIELTSINMHFDRDIDLQTLRSTLYEVLLS